MASLGFDPGDPNKWYQSPHLGLIPAGYGGEIFGNCSYYSAVGASYRRATHFTHPTSHPPPHHFTQPNHYPPPQHNYYPPPPSNFTHTISYPPPHHFSQSNHYPPPQHSYDAPPNPYSPPLHVAQPNSYPPSQSSHSGTLIHGHWLPLQFPCASQSQAQYYHSPHLQPTHHVAPQPLTTSPQSPSIPSSHPIAQQPLTTSPQNPSIPSYYTPHPNPNLQIHPTISPNSSHEPMVVHSHLWRARSKQVALESTAATGGVKKHPRFWLGTVALRHAGKSQKRNQLLMRKPKFQRLLGAITQVVKSGLRLHSSHVEQPETTVKLKRRGKLLSPRSQVDKSLKFGSLPSSSLDLIMTPTKGNSVRTSTNPRLNLSQHKVKFNSEISTKPVVYDIPTHTDENLSLKNDIGVVVESGSNCKDGISTGRTGILIPECTKMGASIEKKESKIPSTEGVDNVMWENNGQLHYSQLAGIGDGLPVGSTLLCSMVLDSVGVGNGLLSGYLGEENIHVGHSPAKMQVNSEMVLRKIWEKWKSTKECDSTVREELKLDSELWKYRELFDQMGGISQVSQAPSAQGDTPHDRAGGLATLYEIWGATHVNVKVFPQLLDKKISSTVTDNPDGKPSLVSKDLDSKEAIIMFNKHTIRPPDDFQVVDHKSDFYRVFSVYLMVSPSGSIRNLAFTVKESDKCFLKVMNMSLQVLIRRTKCTREKYLLVSFYKSHMQPEEKCLGNFTTLGMSADLTGEYLDNLCDVLHNLGNIMATYQKLILAVLLSQLSSNKSAFVNECLMLPSETIVVRLVGHLGEELLITISYTHVDHSTVCLWHKHVILVEKSHSRSSCQVAFDYGLTIILQNVNEELLVYSTLCGLALLNYDILHGVVWSEHWPLDKNLKQELVVMEHGTIHSAFKVPCKSTTMQPKIDECLVQYVEGTTSTKIMLHVLRVDSIVDGLVLLLLLYSYATDASQQTFVLLASIVYVSGNYASSKATMMTLLATTSCFACLPVLMFRVAFVGTWMMMVDWNVIISSMCKMGFTIGLFGKLADMKLGALIDATANLRIDDAANILIAQISEAFGNMRLLWHVTIEVVQNFRNTGKHYCFHGYADVVNKCSFKLLDKLKAEHECGNTTDITLGRFEATKYYNGSFAPRHPYFIKEIFTGTSKADYVVLIIHFIAGGFEDDISNDGQTYEHILFSFTLRDKQVYQESCIHGCAKPKRKQLKAMTSDTSLDGAFGGLARVQAKILNDVVQASQAWLPAAKTFALATFLIPCDLLLPIMQVISTIATTLTQFSSEVCRHINAETSTHIAALTIVSMEM